MNKLIKYYCIATLVGFTFCVLAGLTTPSTPKKTIVFAGTLESGLTSTIQNFCNKGYEVKSMESVIRFPKFEPSGWTDKPLPTMVIVVMEK